VRLATLDGEVTVGITASDGQLEIRTSVPDPRGDGSGTSTDVSARLGSRRVALRRCGPGCFVGPAEWLRGPNAVAVTAASRSWPGGTANFRVPWPPAPDARLLRRVVAAMRATRLVTVHESVTSDTAGPPPVIATHTLSGADFVSVEPYSAAAMPVATVVGHDAGGTELAFAMPAQGYYFALRVAANDRVVGEVITTPEHLYTRTFDYPAATSR
jgi:copper transport protein